ncbi:MAG: RNA polymerase sigma factor RpoH [Gammaproteobacteria bacterium]|nr:RNA polymerase sigma factor RpoH [Gammaproteobacteria bacterium]
MTAALVAKQSGLVFAGPMGSLDSYVSRVSQIPVLSKDDEIALATRFRADGDLDAARELVLSHLRFVVHIARGYVGYGLPMGDLIQEGNVGLMKAVKRFDPTVGVRLVSFAVHWVRAEIHEYVLRNWRLVKVATTKAQRKLFFNLRRMKKNLAWLSEAETQAVAKDLGVEPRDVREMEQRLSARDLAFDPVPDNDEDETYSPALYLPATNADPAVEIEREEWEEVSSDRLNFAIGKLDERSRNILRRRWMTEDKATLHELADEYGISAERVRQVEVNAINKLKGLMAV